MRVDGHTVPGTDQHPRATEAAVGLVLDKPVDSCEQLAGGDVRAAGIQDGEVDLTLSPDVHIMPEWSCHKGIADPIPVSWESIRIPKIVRPAKGDNPISANLEDTLRVATQQTRSIAAETRTLMIAY